MEVREVAMYRAIPHLSPIGLSVIHQADEKHVDVTFQRSHLLISSLILINQSYPLYVRLIEA